MAGRLGHDTRIPLWTVSSVLMKTVAPGLVGFQVGHKNPSPHTSVVPKSSRTWTPRGRLLRSQAASRLGFAKESKELWKALDKDDSGRWAEELERFIVCLVVVVVSDNLLVFTVGNIYKDPLTHIWQGSFMFFSAAPTHLWSTYVYLGWHLFLALRSRRSGDWASPPARCSSKPPTSQKASHSKLRGTSLPPHYVPLLERQTPNAPLAHSATPPLRHCAGTACRF